MPTDVSLAVLTAITTTVTAEALKTFSPYLPTLLGLKPSEKDGLTVWHETQGRKRADDLLIAYQKLKSENDTLKEQISELEKQSPRSGYTQTLEEYMTTPVEAKLDMLRNALLNGIYGDYDIGQREEFYKIAGHLYPIDVQVLQYLVKICPDYEAYLQWNEEKKAKVSHKKDMAYPLLKFETILHCFQDTENYSTLDPTKAEAHRKAMLERSIDRLRMQSLIYSDRVNEQSYRNDPYSKFIPLKIAGAFLAFISEPSFKASSASS